MRKLLLKVRIDIYIIDDFYIFQIQMIFCIRCYTNLLIRYHFTPIIFTCILLNLCTCSSHLIVFLCVIVVIFYVNGDICAGSIDKLTEVTLLTLLSVIDIKQCSILRNNNNNLLHSKLWYQKLQLIETCKKYPKTNPARDSWYNQIPKKYLITVK